MAWRRRWHPCSELAQVQDVGTLQSARYCQPLPNDSSLLSCAEQMLYEPEATPRT